jgi:hypothetical protein
MKKTKEKTPKTVKAKKEKVVETPVEKLEVVENAEEVKTLTIPIDLIARVALMGIELLLKYINKRMENGAVRDKIKEDAELYAAIQKGDGETIARIIKYRKEYKQ